MIVEISTIEFIVSCADKIRDAGFERLYALALKIERDDRHIRINITQQSYTSILNRYRLLTAEKKIDSNSKQFRKLKLQYGLPDAMKSKLIKIIER